VDKNMIGKKVAFFEDLYQPEYQGSWRQFIYLKQERAIVFPDEIE
jgi:hypothetical protein